MSNVVVYVLTGLADLVIRELTDNKDAIFAAVIGFIRELVNKLGQDHPLVQGIKGQL